VLTKDRRRILKIALILAAKAIALFAALVFSFIVLAVLGNFRYLNLFQLMPGGAAAGAYIWASWLPVCIGLAVFNKWINRYLPVRTKKRAPFSRERPAVGRPLRRTILWLPSLIGAFFLFCFPIASHLLHPGSRYLPHYRIPIRWTDTILPSIAFQNSVGVVVVTNDLGVARFGMTPWSCVVYCGSEMVFQTLSGPAEEFESKRSLEPQRDHATNHWAHVFMLGTLTLTCFQSIYTNPAVPSDGYASVHCDTPPSAGARNLHAGFSGNQRHVQRFYDLLQATTYVE
jgi:hypothetical protein